MGKPWFHVKRYGLGAGLPCSWEGWTVVAAFFAVIFATGLAELAPGPRIAIIVIAAVAFMVVARLKSDAPWKWRWGGK
jgi:hypothetical protein